MERLVAIAILLVAIAYIGLGVWREISNLMSTGPAAYVQTFLPAPELPTLTVNIAFTEYENLLGQRELALSDGVFLAGEGDFQPATIELRDSDGQTQEIPVRMRLRQGLASDLGQGEKWPFDVRTRAGASLFGMRRFTLQDPAENNWLNQWVFDRALEQAGLLAARTSFVNLVINGEPQGIYAVQEGFGEELLISQGREPGVIVEYDADRLWESIRYFAGNSAAAFADPFLNLSDADFRTFEVDAFRDASLSRDPELAAQRSQAIGLLRALQEGRVRGDEVFDAEKYGTFLALTDLWSATDGLSLVNLRYYYNPETGRLEPIANNGNPLHEDGRIPASSFFDNPAIQASYLTAAERFSQPGYIDQLEATISPELARLQRAVGVEENVEAPWEILRQRQGLLLRALNPIQPIFAYMGPPMSESIQVDVANIYGLPLEVLGFDIGGATFLDANKDWIQNADQDLLIADNFGRIILRSQDGPAVRYLRFLIPLVEIERQDEELDGLSDIVVSVATRLVGREDIQMTQAQSGYPLPVLPVNEEN